MKKALIKNLLLTLISALPILSCENFVDLDPPNSRVVSKVVFESDKLAISAMNGIYQQLFSFSSFASGSVHSVTSVCGLSADELKTNNTLLYMQLLEYEQNEVNPDNQSNFFLWSSAYNIIYGANSLLEGIEGSEKISTDIKNQLEGEAKFIRAFAHFYLVNLFGEVPIITTTDYNQNALVIRKPVTEVYDQIIIDLMDSKSILVSDYRDGQKTNINNFTATALLARVYLYLGDWVNAEKMATEVLTANAHYSLNNNLADIFLSNSNEAIWQIAPFGSTGMTREGSYFVLINPNSFTTPVALSSSMVNAFEPEDKRFVDWIGTIEDDSEKHYYPYKYKISFTTEPPTEYSTVLRLAEQFLIRAEARTNLGNIMGAKEDINTIRHRAGLGSTQASTEAELILAILQERRVELFTEWGHRWLDLKRIGEHYDTSPITDQKLEITDLLFPIPEQEMLRNPNMVQNPGY